MATIEPAVAKLEADYNHFFENTGLKFCLAYCAGLETIGPMVASFFFNRAPDLMRNWHEPTTYLWLWHMAEEYEHRVVTNYTLRELCESYWYRVYGMWYAAIHLFGFALGVAGKLIQEDRAKGRIRGKWASRFRYGKVLFRVFGHFFGHYVTAHRPTYDPATIPAPSRATELLAEIGENKAVRIPQED